jgi:excisionase family DNA binding protein
MKAAIRAATDPGVPMSPKPRQLVTLCEAAEILAVSVKTVRRYIAAGDLDAVRLGRRTIRIKTESLDRMIDAHPVNTWRGHAS